jgi:hypothetical protein
MDPDDFAASQREREWFHALTVPPGAWPVIRVDGRAFSQLTEAHFAKPFDERMRQHMTAAASALITEFGAVYGCTHSDEISIALPPDCQLFGRGLEKLVSVSSGICSAAFTPRPACRRTSTPACGSGLPPGMSLTISPGANPTLPARPSVPGVTGPCGRLGTAPGRPPPPSGAPAPHSRMNCFTGTGSISTTSRHGSAAGSACTGRPTPNPAATRGPGPGRPPSAAGSMSTTSSP